MTTPTSQTNVDALLGTVALPWWRRRWWWIAIALAAALVVGIAIRWLGKPVVVDYFTVPVQRGDLTITVSATGNLAPTNQIDVGSEISGIVEQVTAEVNDRVNEGQTLAVLDTSRLQDAVRQSEATLSSSTASVTQARATLTEAQAQLARLRDVSRLSGGRVPSQSEMAAQQANVARAAAAVRVAQASVASARAQLSSNQTQVGKAVIRSPVSGVVLKRTVDPGQTVQAAFNTPSLFIIAEDLRAMKLEVAVDEADVGQVREGLPATFTVDAYPGRKFPAKISRVDLGSRNLSGSSSSSTRSTSNVVSYTASLTLSNADLTLRPGMTATATIQTAGERNVMIVPNAALRFTPPTDLAKPKKSILSVSPPTASSFQAQQERGIGAGSAQVVYVLQADNSLRSVAVVTGQTDGRNTAVTSSELKPGMAVVTGQKAHSADD